MIGQQNLKVGVFGVKGQMGVEVKKAVEGADDLIFSAAVDADDSLESMRGCDVAVDFTTPSVVMNNIKWGIENGVNLVVGTTGFTPDRLEKIRVWLGENPKTGVLIAPNFSIGAVLMMKFAAQAAPYYESVEIIELHHPRKADAPSGTASQTAKMIAKARQDAQLGSIPDATVQDAGARGAVVDGVHIHSVRVAGLTAHQEVLLGSGAETLQIRHDTFDRSSFMPGVLAGVRYIVSHPGITLGIEPAIGI